MKWQNILQELPLAFYSFELPISTNFISLESSPRTSYEEPVVTGEYDTDVTFFARACELLEASPNLGEWRATC